MRRYTDAQHEPVGWRDRLEPVSMDGWVPPVVVGAPGNETDLKPKMSRPMHILPHPPPVVIPVPGNQSMFLIDFGKELQGGLIFSTSSGNANQSFYIDAGEARALSDPKNKTNHGHVTDSVTSDWGYFFNWRMRAGAQVIEQHQYMEFRYVNIVFDGIPPAEWNLTAWQAQYEWEEEDSFFHCSNATLQAVWELNQYVFFTLVPSAT